MDFNQILIHTFFFRFVRFLIMAIWASFMAFALKKTTKRKRPLGVTILAVLLIAGSIHKLFGFVDYDYYKMMFQHLPENLIFARYVGSISLRLICISIGIGLLLLNNISRISTIFLATYTIITIPFKHQIEIFKNVATHLAQQFQSASYANNPEDFKYITYAAIFFWTIDLLFSVTLIYYFTRRKVKAEFKKVFPA